MTDFLILLVEGSSLDENHSFLPQSLAQNEWRVAGLLPAVAIYLLLLVFLII